MIYNIRFDIYLGKSYDRGGKAGVSNEALRTCLSTPLEVLEYFAQSTSVLPA